MHTVLNLARKWRPKTFDDVVGQDIPISMLRNSLYKGHFFPLYLCAGQKGCGKTSTARILAAATNCDALQTFQSTARTPLPCLSCPSCLRMKEGAHPDFIEIDAASHTGVDDIRALLESCSFLPILGRKKIYLIDEAHMLSRAAFNAFLKILEEPPAHTLFILATTELLKIPDTVRSRAFQLHFAALAGSALLAHLETICVAESISYEREALALIMAETDGSARDAINLLEQVRFAAPTITTATVRTVLGIISPVQLGVLLALSGEADTTTLLQELTTLNLKGLNASRLWQLLMQLLRHLLWQSYNVPAPDDACLLPDELAQRLKKSFPQERLHALCTYLWHQEELFSATPYKQLFLEKIFLDISVHAYDLPTSGSRSTPHLAGPAAPKPERQAPSIMTPLPAHQPSAKPQEALPTSSGPVKAHTPDAGPWHAFVSAVEQLHDPLLLSILKQAQFSHVSTDTVHLTLPQVNPFLTDRISETKERWQPLLQQHFPGCLALSIQANTVPPSSGQAPVAKPLPTHQPSSVTPVKPTPAIPAPVIKPPATGKSAAPAGKQPWQSGPRKPVRESLVPRGTPLVLTDDNKAQWPYTTRFVEVFPGKLEIIHE